MLPANGLEGFALSLELPRFLTQVEVQGFDYDDMGGCQNYDPFLGTLNIRCRTTIGTIILTTTHIEFRDIIPIMGKQTERQLENEMETVDL